MFGKKVLPLEKRQGEEVGRLILEMITHLMINAGTIGISIKSVACCVPGIAYSGTGRVWAPNIGGWIDYPLLDRIKAGMDDPTISVLIDNDRACSIMGEWQGRRRAAVTSYFLQLHRYWRRNHDQQKNAPGTVALPGTVGWH
jgi:glucokinase